MLLWLPRQEGYVFGLACLSDYLCVCPSDHLMYNERICMKLLPEVCVSPKKNRLNFGEDPGYDLAEYLMLLLYVYF